MSYFEKKSRHPDHEGGEGSTLMVSLTIKYVFYGFPYEFEIPFPSPFSVTQNHNSHSQCLLI